MPGHRGPMADKRDGDMDMDMDKDNDETFDVVVVGGGAAGLSGALALARARRSGLGGDAGEPRNAPAGHVHNYLAREGTPPAQLVSAGRGEVTRYGGGIVAGRGGAGGDEGDGLLGA